jgi:hypothetical protein
MSKVQKPVVAVLILAAVSFCGMAADAADPTVTASEIVQYRLAKWKTAHTNGKVNTDKLVKTLKTLRCEVKVGSHGGHTDVRYRCSKWHKLSLKDHASAHQWETWLKKYGFETKHAH